MIFVETQANCGQKRKISKFLLFFALASFTTRLKQQARWNFNNEIPHDLLLIYLMGEKKFRIAAYI